MMDAVGMAASFPGICLTVVTWTGDSLNFVLFLESFIYISMHSYYN